MTTGHFDAPGAIPLNDESDYGLCFACGQQNANGLQLTFERQGDQIVTTYKGGRTTRVFLASSMER